MFFVVWFGRCEPGAGLCLIVWCEGSDELWLSGCGLMALGGCGCGCW